MTSVLVAVALGVASVLVLAGVTTMVTRDVRADRESAAAGVELAGTVPLWIDVEDQADGDRDRVEAVPAYWSKPVRVRDDAAEPTWALFPRAAETDADELADVLAGLRGLSVEELLTAITAASTEMDARLRGPGAQANQANDLIQTNHMNKWNQMREGS